MRPARKRLKKQVSSHPQINKRFKTTRIKQDLVQKQMAKKCKTSVSTVKQIEAGNILPNIEIIRKWKKEFNLSYDWIIDGVL